MIILDTSFIVAYKVEDDEHHIKAKEIIERLISGNYGVPIISDYIFDETMTVSFTKTKKLRISEELGNELIDSLDIINIDEDMFQESWNIFKSQKDTKFSFTDSTILALMKWHGIKNIATFDEDFKKIKDINVID